jgi:hypothetical protein
MRAMRADRPEAPKQPAYRSGLFRFRPSLKATEKRMASKRESITSLL